MRGGDECTVQLNCHLLTFQQSHGNKQVTRVNVPRELETGKNSERNDSARELRDLLNRQTPSGIYYNTRTGYHA